ncbi:MAG: phosphate acyltransferase PlsX [Candidatus Eisenbacteria bacterium]|uniref:Phosphate acyltransferase n=1 Tax=Eiseniibacteriota bacterium TaxID=2212470 RepID=A0A9D6QJ48_UNCEI|nr:phosphate acyltransferase PlsX [Candidatus Eisenbacteria bacterium]
MGGDHGPTVVAEGVVQALREQPGRFTVTLVGDEGEIRAALARAGADGRPIEVVHTSGQVDMGEKAAAAARRRTTTSIGVVTQLHKEGKVDAIFSAGNTGAVVATALLGLGRLESVSRPALAAFLPNAGEGTVVLDVGANAECKASYLVQFAHMGSVYARYLLGRPNPRVGLLSIGEEETKGNSLVQEALPLLKRSSHLNFIGNVEGRDVFEGSCDVVVTDGFTGNVVLKTAESVVTFLGQGVKREIRRDILAKIAVMFLAPALHRMKAQIDWEEHGAAPLLGVNGVVFVGHGGSGPRAFRSAIRTMTRFVEQRVNEHIREELRADHVTAA